MLWCQKILLFHKHATLFLSFLGLVVMLEDSVWFMVHPSALVKRLLLVMLRSISKHT